MDLSLPAVVGWLFVAIFAAVAIIVLLDLAGIRRIADDSQRKWLFRGLIISVVTAVSGLGIAHLKKQEQTPEVNLVAGNSPTPSQTSSHAPVQQPARPVKPAPSGPTPQPGPADVAQCPADAAVLEWASANLGPRPMLQPGFDQDYPKCVAELAARDTGDTDNVEQCLAALEGYRSAVLQKGFYDVKVPYDAALLKWERELRRGQITEEERPRYNYVLCENDDLNGAEGKSLEARDAAEERLRLDRRACRSNHCLR